MVSNPYKPKILGFLSKLMMTQALGTACIPRGPAVEMPFYEFLCHELFDEQFLFLSPWKAGKLRVDFSFQPSYTVGTVHCFWGSHSRDGNSLGMSASKQDSGIGILVNVMRGVEQNLRETSYLAERSFLKKWRKKLLTPVFSPSWRGISLASHFLVWTEGWYYLLHQAIEHLSVWVFLGSRSAV